MKDIVLENINIGILIVNNELRNIYANKFMITTFNYDINIIEKFDRDIFLNLIQNTNTIAYYFHYHKIFYL